MSSCGRVKTGRAIPWFYSGLASGGVYRACPVAGTAVSSYLTFPPLPAKAGGLFLLHYPWSRLRRPLTGALPCEARTFLTCITSATVRLTHRIILTQKTAGRKGAGGKIHQILFMPSPLIKVFPGLTHGIRCRRQTPLRASCSVSAPPELRGNTPKTL